LFLVKRLRTFTPHKTIFMKKTLLAIAAFLYLHFFAAAQLTTPPNGGNKKATVAERVGLTDITIHYDRPGVKGREGKIWGTLVAYGFTDLGFGTSKAAPWRAGANENTTIEFSTDVKVEGKDLPAGKYGFFIAVGKEESIIIFSKNTSSWGSYFYDDKQDVLRVTVKQKVNEQAVEWLRYEFMNQTANSATIALLWEKWMFPLTVETDLNKNQADLFRNELKSDKGFEWKAWAQAASWCAENNTNLPEGLLWADYAISGQYIGEKNFNTLSIKSRLLNLAGKAAEADALMKETLALGSMDEVLGYAGKLMAAKNTKAAADLFRVYYKKYPNKFSTNMGMVSALSSEGNFKEALKYANAALKQAPDESNKKNVESIIEKLKIGKDVN
jgi:tetratricopeptide (TPR) repeat protein